MTYVSRIPADADYLSALGRAFYNFTYLEWAVISTIAKLSANGHEAVPWGQTARFIACALLQAMDAGEPPLDNRLRRRLLGVYQTYRAAIKKRNKLLHAHPLTAVDGAQRLGVDHREWTMEEVDAVAQFFEKAAIDANGIYHDHLVRERP